jgi:outer membrane protein OmpA-like peptidoglycan-associated protein
MRRNFSLSTLCLALLLLFRSASAQIQGERGDSEGAKFGIGIGGGINQPFHFYDTNLGYLAALKLKLFLAPEFNFNLQAAYQGTGAGKKTVDATGGGNAIIGVGGSGIVGLNLTMQYNFLTKSAFNPYIFAGGSLQLPGVSEPTIRVNGTPVPNSSPYKDNSLLGGVVGGLGAEYFIAERVSIDANVAYNYFFADRLTAVPYREANPSTFVPSRFRDGLNSALLTGLLGLNVYFGDYAPPPPPPSPSVTFTATPTSVDQGKSATLSWSVMFADTVMLDGQMVDTVGSRTVTPTQTTTYTLTAIGKGGTINSTASVTVIPPPPPPPTLKTLKVGEKLAYKINFASGRATIDKADYPKLDEIASELLERPDMVVEISGHTDNVGNPRRNLALSRQRAQAVKNYLVKKKVPARNMVVRGAGDKEPVGDNSTEVGREQNRRIEFKVLRLIEPKAPRKKRK